MTLQPGQILKDRYEIDHLLGQGGMGAVYRALDTLPVPPVPVALKERSLAGLPEEPVPSENTPDETRMRGASPVSIFTRKRAAEQFKTEARLLHNFQHPNLPRVSDYFAEGDCLYLAMELIEGRNLDQILEANGDRPLPEADVLNWLGQVMDALAYCHSHNIFHRDIKPANIILNPQGKAYLVDFGIARFSSDGRVTTILGGTPGFSPLEQISRRGVVDARSDIYALGATLYLLLTGQTPEDALDRALADELVEPRQINPSITPQVESAILQALRMKPEDRFSSVEKLVSYLLPFAMPTDVPVPSISENLQLTTQHSFNINSTSGKKSHRVSSESTTIEVYPNQQLSRAINVAPAGSTVKIHCGNYNLSKTLYIGKDLHIVAFGDGRPRITSSDNEAVVIFSDGSWTLEGLDFIHEGKKGADVVRVEGKRIVIKDCRFSGGISTYGFDGITGDGLLIRGQTECQVILCLSNKNSRNGICVTGSITFLIESNSCEENHCGISCSNSTKGQVVNNQCINNMGPGIEVFNSTMVSLENNICEHSHLSSGIRFSNINTGQIIGNRCQYNICGISMSTATDITLVNNICSGNGDGISFSGKFSGTVIENQCLRNDRHGIVVEGSETTPLIVNNTCYENKRHGILILKNANPKIGLNNLSGNKKGESNKDLSFYS